MSRNKGQRAEREVVKLLQPVVIEVWDRMGGERVAPSLERNLMQSHKGGHDIVGLEWLALEVKHQEAQQTEAWWNQTKIQSKRVEDQLDRPVEPVLFYRRNNVAWRVRMFGYLGAGTAGRVRCPVDITPAAFLAWFKLRLEQELRP